MDALADTIRTDVAIVGAGIAGAGLAADLAGDFDVVLIEQESRPGYHSTGRSAAIFIQNYGNAAIRALTINAAKIAGASLMLNRKTKRVQGPVISSNIHLTAARGQTARMRG